MRVILCMLLAMIPLIHPCYAADPITQLYPESDIQRAKDMLSDDVRSIVDSYGITDGNGLQAAADKLLGYIRSHGETELKSLLKPTISIFAVILLCGILEPLLSGEQKGLPLQLFGCVEILYLTISDAEAFFKMGINAIGKLYDFSTVLLPSLAAASIAAGASVSAGVKYTAASLFMNILLNVSTTVLVPLISVYLVCVIGNTVFDQKILGALSNLIHRGSKTAVTWCTIIFTAYLNIAGLISSTGDLFATRITKSALTSALPVVGSIIANTASSLVAGAALLRNSIGIFGLLSVLGILSLPFIRLGLRYLLFLGVGHLAELFAGKRFSSLLNGIAGAFGMLLGVIGSGFIMIFLTLVSFMQMVGGT